MAIVTKTRSQPISREKFLQLSARIALSLAGILGLGGLVRYFSHRSESGPPSTYHLGPAADFPRGGTLIRPDIPAVIYQTEGKFRAYSLICTHLGCTLEEDGKGFSCPCHGSEFSPDGVVLKGPAVDDLPALEVEITESGELLVRIPRGQL
jgi:cytochrome b6-f complex iron-sulfur subunit